MSRPTAGLPCRSDSPSGLTNAVARFGTLPSSSISSTSIFLGTAHFMSTTAFHDPRREVEKVREHLGSNEGRLAFLIGAGTSAAVLDSDRNPLIPTVTALSETCRVAVAALGEDHSAAYESIRAECEAELKTDAEEADPPVLARPVNVGDILSAVRTGFVGARSPFFSAASLARFFIVERLASAARR